MPDECPICDTQMKVYIDKIDWGGPICENYETCPNGCYAYEYAYGYTTVHVGDKQFGWTYSTDKEAVHAEQAAVEAAIEAARENQS